MYIARFSYEVLPVNRQRAIDFIRQEVEVARLSAAGALTGGPFEPAGTDEPGRTRSVPGRGLGPAKRVRVWRGRGLKVFASSPVPKSIEDRRFRAPISVAGFQDLRQRWSFPVWS